MWLQCLAWALVISAVVLAFILAHPPFAESGSVIADGNLYRHYQYYPTRTPRTPTQGITLVVEYFLSQVPARREELLFCYRHNLGLKELDRIVFLTHDADEEKQFRELFGTPPKAVLQRITNPRATFGDLFTQGNRYAGPEDTLIVANSDIAFDETVSYLKYLLPEEAAALSRHELTSREPLEGKITIKTKWSSDAWAFRGRAKANLEKLRFTPGKLACDCVLSQCLVNLGGYKVFNPCYDVKIYHVHGSKIRSYGPKDYVRELGYLIEGVRWKPEDSRESLPTGKAR